MRIDIDTCEEILITITRNKTRSLLTAFGVFWGIFMLVALIGGGQGLEYMLKKNFEGFATNSGFLASQRTGEAYKGFRKGRWWNLESTDIERLRSQVKEVEVITPSVARWGSKAVYEDKKYDCSVKGLYPDYLHIESQEMAYGRFINEVDIREARKVCVIGKRIYESLFKPGENPCGKYVRVDGIYYQVIGMSSSEGDMNIQGRASEAVTLPFTTMQQAYNLGGQIDVVCFTAKQGVKVSELQPKVVYQVVGLYNDKGDSGDSDAYIPFSTLQTIYNKGDKLNNLIMTTKNLETIEANEKFETYYRKVLGANHRFDPTDHSAIWIWNRFTNYLQQQQGSAMLRIAIWVIGIFTLLSGIVGVSNIMLITVKERTREFGIRKALGAKPLSILWLIIVESVTITTIFGYIGMVAGIGATEWMNNAFGNQTMDTGMWTETVFLNPTVDIRIAIQATLTLIIAGTLAGLFPARKAVSIRPIEALRAD